MNYTPFDNILPKIGQTQIRTLIFLEEHTGIAKGDYAFVPAYCMDPKCDCRRALVYVIEAEAQDPIAVISYGWESKAFYHAWAPHLGKAAIEWFKGPALDPFQPQGPQAEIWVAYFQKMLKDPEYARRCISLYTKFKWEIGMKIPKDLQPYLGLTAPCLCESGELYKSCCGAKQARRRRRKLR